MNPFSRFTSLFPRIREGVVSALGRFPWMLLSGLAGTVAAIVAYRHGGEDLVADRCARTLLTATLGMPLFFSLRMVRERLAAGRGLLIDLAGLPLLAAWYLTLPPMAHTPPGIVFIRWGLLLAALHFIAAVSPYAGGASGGGFWQFNRRIFLRFCLATLYAGLLTGGLELAVLSADKLFELNLDNSYANLFFVMAGCFHPVFFLAGVPRDFDAPERDDEYPRGLKAFTQFVLAPLVAVYTVILYAYGIKIVAARSWPHGWVALPVLILSGVGILCALLLHPLRARPGEKWGGWFCRNFPRALAPLSVLLLLSVWQRVKDYGVTEERYLGIVAGAWVLVWGFIFIVNRNAGIRWIPASLAAICGLAALGPWSAGAISEASQLRRVTALLETHGLLVNGTMHHVKGVILPEEVYDDISSTLNYLDSTHGARSLRPLAGDLLPHTDWNNAERGSVSGNILDAMGVVRESEASTSSASYYIDTDLTVSQEGFKTVSYLQDVCDSNDLGSKRKAGAMFIAIQNGVMKMESNNTATPQAVQLDGLLKSLPIDSKPNLTPEQLTADWQQDGNSFRIIFIQLTIERPPDGSILLQNCSFLLLEK